MYEVLVQVGYGATETTCCCHHVFPTDPLDVRLCSLASTFFAYEYESL